MKRDPASLHLNLHREFFTAIAAGTKKTENRARTPYWQQRLATPRKRGGRSCLENPLYPLANPLLYVYNHF
jgi:hypothetical protein